MFCGLFVVCFFLFVFVKLMNKRQRGPCPYQGMSSQVMGTDRGREESRGGLALFLPGACCAWHLCALGWDTGTQAGSLQGGGTAWAHPKSPGEQVRVTHIPVVSCSSVWPHTPPQLEDLSLVQHVGYTWAGERDRRARLFPFSACRCAGCHFCCSRRWPNFSEQVPEMWPCVPRPSTPVPMARGMQRAKGDPENPLADDLKGQLPGWNNK